MRPSRGIRVGPAGKKGRGIFATKEFLTGDLIERSPILLIDDKEDIEWIQETSLDNYWYSGDESQAFGLGYTSLYNHSYRPNAIYHLDEHAEVITIVALRTIKKGAEITINYNGDPKDKTKLKFRKKAYERPDETPESEHVDDLEDDAPWSRIDCAKLRWHYLDGNWVDGDDAWMWCGKNGNLKTTTWTSVPGLVTCKKCLENMMAEKIKLETWDPKGLSGVPHYDLVRLMEQARDQLIKEDAIFYSEVVRESIKVMRQLIERPKKKKASSKKKKTSKRR